MHCRLFQSAMLFHFALQIFVDFLNLQRTFRLRCRFPKICNQLSGCIADLQKSATNFQGALQIIPKKNSKKFPPNFSPQNPQRHYGIASQILKSATQFSLKIVWHSATYIALQISNICNELLFVADIICNAICLMCYRFPISATQYALQIFSAMDMHKQ